jgi:hypothetical protein
MLQKTAEKSYIRSKQKYGVISQNIMRNPYITPTAKALYSYLASFAGSENTAFPGRNLICHDMGFNKDTFTKYMWELECWDIVQKEKLRGQSGQFNNNLYILDHYPELVMMEKDIFEERYWPELEKQLKSKGNKSKSDKSASSPCPKFSDMDETDSPCPKIPDTVKPDPVEPDPVFSDTNNNSLNNNSLNNNRFNNNNLNNNNEVVSTSLELPSMVEEDKTAVVVVPSTQFSTGDKLESVDRAARNILNTADVKLIFSKQGITSLPDAIIQQLRTSYSQNELIKIAQVLHQKKEQGYIKNPTGLLVSGRAIPDSILRNEFYPDTDKKKKAASQERSSKAPERQYSEYEIYIPPGR